MKEKFNSRMLFLPFVWMVLLLVLAACSSSTKVISSWSIEPSSPETLKKVLVLGVMNNREDRDQAELAMVRELNKAGVNAVTATSVFGPKQFRGLAEEEITKKLKGSGFTSVMIISLVDKEKERNYVPGQRYYSPRIYGYSRYYRRYLYVYDEIYTPGYYTTSTNYILEADIYTVDVDDELIYSAQTRSYDPNSAKSLAESFAKSIVEELKVKRIIK